MASASNVPKPRTLKKWTAEFKWLEIRENRMYCRLCTKWQKKLASCRNYSDAFITKGSNNWQRSAVNEHNTSAMHSDANGHENREILGDQFRKHVVHTIPEDNPLKQCFARMSENERHMLVRSFEQSLEDNLRIHVAGPDLTKFSETYVAKAVKAWYNDRPRRVHQKKRKKYKQRATSKKPNADLGLDLADICHSGGEDSSSSDCESESGSSETD